MPDNDQAGEHGVHSTVSRLGESLRSYIEAQYHIRHEGLIRERRQLLEERGSVAQLPFVESTPVYELGPPTKISRFRKSRAICLRASPN
ncbi:MAG: hypothetical protein ACLPSW_14955 [Roseiarcus sp.]